MSSRVNLDNANLNEREKEALRAILNKYDDVFVAKDDVLGHTR